MNITWLVQDTSRSNFVIDEDVNNLRELGFNIVPFGIIPFTNEITGIDHLDPNDNYIIRGGTRVVSLLESGLVENLNTKLVNKLKCGVHHSDGFEQAMYTTFGLPLLNSSPEILDLSDSTDLYASYDVDKFVKPSSDMKAFTAGILESGTVLKHYIENCYHRADYKNEFVIVHDCIKIFGEYRFVCINDTVISGSRYQQNGRLVVNTDIPIEVLNAADEYAQLYHPSEIFTMDLCETEDGIKIVEYNCWNCSGLYAMDIKKVFSAVNNYYLTK